MKKRFKIEKIKRLDIHEVSGGKFYVEISTIAKTKKHPDGFWFAVVFNGCDMSYLQILESIYTKKFPRPENIEYMNYSADIENVEWPTSIDEIDWSAVK